LQPSTPTPSTKNPFDVTAEFTNGTSIELTDCVFTFEGIGTERIKVVDVG
jgi:hypothetical protein